MPKIKRKIFLYITLFVFLIAIAPFITSAIDTQPDGFMVSSGETKVIGEYFGLKLRVKNNGVKSYFVPTKTVDEFSRFFNEGVTGQISDLVVTDLSPVNNLVFNVAPEVPAEAPAWPFVTVNKQAIKYSWSANHVTDFKYSLDNGVNWTSINAYSDFTDPTNPFGMISGAASQVRIYNVKVRACNVVLGVEIDCAVSDVKTFEAVALPTCSAYWNPIAITAPGTSNIIWNSANAVSATYSCAGIVASSGSIDPAGGSIPLSFTASQSGTETCSFVAMNKAEDTCIKSPILQVFPCVPTYTTANCSGYCGLIPASALGGNCGLDVNCGSPCGSCSTCSPISYQCVTTPSVDGTWSCPGTCSVNCGTGVLTGCTCVGASCGGSCGALPTCDAGPCCTFYYKLISGPTDYGTYPLSCAAAYPGIPNPYIVYSYPYKEQYNCYNVFPAKHRLVYRLFQYGCW